MTYRCSNSEYDYFITPMKLLIESGSNHAKAVNAYWV